MSSRYSLSFFTHYCHLLYYICTYLSIYHISDIKQISLWMNNFVCMCIVTCLIHISLLVVQGVIWQIQLIFMQRSAHHVCSRACLNHRVCSRAYFCLSHPVFSRACLNCLVCSRACLNHYVCYRAC